MSKKNESEKKKKKRGMSTKNLKEHCSFYKWIKHYGAILVELDRRLKILEERIDTIERRARDNYFAWCYGGDFGKRLDELEARLNSLLEDLERHK